MLPGISESRALTFIYLAHLVLPFAAIAWLAFAPAEGPRLRALQLVSVILFLVGFWLAGAWFYPPSEIRLLHAALLLGAIALAMSAPWSVSRAPTLWGVGALALILGGLGIVATAQGVIGRLTPDRTFDLDAPLAEGRFCVVSGGSTPLLNFHMFTLAPGFDTVRGQSFGVDFVAVDDDGLRADSIWPRPRDLDAYYIYGAPIVAPCSGRVVYAYDDVADSEIGGRRSAVLPGNHVILACGDHEILLAHMAPGSVRARAGNYVQSGDLLGRVGNSGFSDEPHLHLHVQRRPPRGAPPQSGEPVHVTFNGRFLARGDCLD
jgi:hypothetical protein